MKVVYDGVVKKYGTVLGVDQLNLEIRSGEFVVLLGPSGCGKTTSLRMLAGLESVTNGSIYIGDRYVNDTPPRDRDVAMVFQSYALYPHMTVAENIAYPLRVRRIPRSEIPGRVQKVAELLGIHELLQRRPRELSGGQRQRVALARAIVRQPRVFLMDEPLSNLDANLRVYTRGELKHLQYELGTTTLYVTHDQAEAMTLAHRVAVMHAGKLQQFDTPINIYERPTNKFVAGFMGSPSMNFLVGKLDHAQRTFVANGLTLHLGAPVLSRLQRHEKAVLGVRPEDVGVSVAQCEGGMPARTYVTETLGNETFVFLDLGHEKIITRTNPVVRLEIGATVWLSFNETKFHFFDFGSGDRIP
ncbi:MAG: glycerol-3-phosphate ABC transporter ATP-binding protein [Acidobacteria bacterium]|nr:MAG: glycerol-3-phosphate ABC transporter ATP-binding protein [Acidobacteriota bacterium]